MLNVNPASDTSTLIEPGTASCLLSKDRDTMESRECSFNEILEVSGNTIGLTLRLCGAIGEMISTREPGNTIGPPTLREYAVEPELVATSMPSAQ